ncbi:hypothetical protein TNCV_1811761 [Trichonephila clavipes]|nr:hypothetical protein TNCV_1811761 [Trichonephila clavipes]
MLGLSGVQSSQIVGVLLSGASVTLTSKLFEFSRVTASTVRTAYKQSSKTSSVKRNSGRKEKLFETERRVLKRIVISKSRTSAAKAAAELNQHLYSYSVNVCSYKEPL